MPSAESPSRLKLPMGLAKEGSSLTHKKRGRFLIRPRRILCLHGEDDQFFPIYLVWNSSTGRNPSKQGTKYPQIISSGYRPHSLTAHL